MTSMQARPNTSLPPAEAERSRHPRAGGPGRIRRRIGLGMAIGVPFGWLFALLFVPTVILFLYSLWRFTSFGVTADWTFDNYAALGRSSNVKVMVFTLLLATAVSLVGVILAYAVALFIGQFRGGLPYLLLLCLVLPFLTNGLLRVFAWKIILGRYGIVNDVLAAIGLPRQDVLLFSTFSLGVVLLYGVLPFMALPVYASLVRIDPQVVMAARDLGASSLQLHRRIILPLVKPGLMMAGLLGFITVLGSWVEPTQVGSSSDLMWGQLIYSRTYDNGNLPLAAAYAFTAGAVTLIIILGVLRFVDLDRFFGRRSTELTA